MKQSFLLLALVLTAISIVSAQTKSDDPQQILERASAKLRSSNGINVTFSLTQKDKYGHTQGGAKGIIKIKGNKYYVKEGDNEIFCNAVQTWNYDGQTEVTVSKAENADAGDLSPQQILSGFNKADFNFKLISSSGTNYGIQLNPIDKRKNFKQIIIYVSKPGNLITKAVITDKTDNITEITFSNINLNAAIPDTQFSFDISKHPGVEVINQ